ncbi:phage portal protein [Staphylococcus equorum]|uniref:Phage portal protein n=1 Tax=Staphylococcus equorum TaxID=246432 RepID=A0A9X4LHT7_9STAP|nr:phage portal protein [Staphylococcus equorum]MDG0860318.1 phage portal protein [Staphylococcus equorum]
MAFWNNFTKNDSNIENRSSTEYLYGGSIFTSYFGGESKVTEDQALKIPAVTSAIELITSSVAQLPIYLYKRNDDGEVVLIKNDNRSFLLNKEPNAFMNAQTFKRQIVRDYLFYGASYLKIEKDRNAITGLYTLPIKELSIEKYRLSPYETTATINAGYGAMTEKYTPDEVVIVLKDSKDGFTSSGILSDNAETLTLALDEQDYTTSILKNGALPIGVLKSASRLSKSAVDRLRGSWENLYAGSKKAGKTVILEEGLDYTPISMKPNELDLTNVRKHTVSEIARIFNVPESMINSDANKYASNEQNNIYFLQYCLASILTSIESSYNKSLLLESEKEEDYFWKFDVSELLRTTEKEKVETILRSMEKGLLSINEARKRIDMPALDDDYFLWNLGSVFYDQETGYFTIPNMGQTLDPKAEPIPPKDPKLKPKDDLTNFNIDEASESSNEEVEK